MRTPKQQSAKMVDVGTKRITVREAAAAGVILMSPATLKVIAEGKLPKGDALSTAEIAGLLAAKQTPNLLPLCHTVPIEKATVQAECDPALPGVRVSAEIRGRARTGFEMEALVAVATALLTIYDMAKAIDPEMIISDISLQRKSGGKSGKWARKVK